jgi:hypothetical protein
VAQGITQRKHTAQGHITHALMSPPPPPAPFPRPSPGQAAKAAYRQALEPHHGWALRHTINAAMSFLPSRVAFFQGLAGPAAPVPGGGIGQPVQPAVAAAGGVSMAAAASASGGAGSSSSLESQLSSFLGLLEPVRAELWRFYGELGLTNLP